jgi:hypothetical protein
MAQPDLRSQRSAYQPGTIRMTIQQAMRGILAAPADIAPLFACTALWMYGAARDGAPGNCCVDAAMILQQALRVLGIRSHPEPVSVAVTHDGAASVYGSEMPHWTTDGRFDGHVVLTVPDAGYLIDATIQQFPEVPRSVHGQFPVIGRLPGGEGLGNMPLAVTRGDHRVVYWPVPGRHGSLWRHETVDAGRAGYCDAGANLAGVAVELLRSRAIRDMHVTWQSIST